MVLRGEGANITHPLPFSAGLGISRGRVVERQY